MIENDLILKIEGLEKVIKEQQDSADMYKLQLEETKKQLDDYNKPEITPMMIDNIHSAIEKAVEGFDFSNTDNYEFEYGMEYDGKVYCESVGLQAAYELTEQIVGNVFKLFKEADCPDELDTTEPDHHKPVE